MADHNPDLLDEVIRFIETEREIYGDFSTEPRRNKTSPLEPASSADRGSTPRAFRGGRGVPDNESEATQNLSLEQKLKSCRNLNELKTLCTTATELKTNLENTNLVFGTGNPSADLMLIGEAPGEQEDIQGEPFVGRAGQLLNKILKAIEFERDDVYIANILKHRPPDNRNPLPEERTRSLPYLLRQIDLVRPKLILCLGKVAGTTLLNTDTTLGSMRGKFHQFRGTELTVTYHPAALLRNPAWKRPAWEDVQMVRKRYDELGGKP